MQRLDGKVAVITGASTAIGLATAQRFAQEGARLFLMGWRDRRAVRERRGWRVHAARANLDEHYSRTFDTNVKGTLFTVQGALPLVRDRGSITLTGSPPH
jgi:NAD(P)-dependent dehydrogenase (short-subunit alcohol dehydrogenase family)